MKRLAIILPDQLHEQLRQDARRAKISMAELVRTKLQQPLIGLPRRRRFSHDPILKVAGVCSGPVLSSGIDAALYGS